MGFGDMRDERQAEACSRQGLVLTRRDAIEFFENSPLLFRVDPDAPIDDSDDGAIALPPYFQTDGPRLALVFHRVAEEVQNGLFDGVPVDADLRQALIDPDVECESLLLQGIFHGPGRGPDDLGERGR